MKSVVRKNLEGLSCFKRLAVSGLLFAHSHDLKTLPKQVLRSVRSQPREA